MMEHDFSQSDVVSFVVEVAQRNNFLIELLPPTRYTLMIFQPITHTRGGPTKEIVEVFARILRDQREKYHLNKLNIKVANEIGPELSFGEDITDNTIYKIVLY
ncbi:MAG: hypothetical protein RL097_515 [Candidatus Parcubacteria bacterium]|jgi:hypothetical protein